MERLNKTTLKQFLKRDFQFFDKIGSTFDVKDSSIIVAAEQLSGVGRQGRSFFSPVGGIYFCIKTEIRPMLTVNAAAGVMRALLARGFSPLVKWVNDIFLSEDANKDGKNNKKVCGILAKADGNSAIIGVGINYCIHDFPPYLKDTATSMYRKSSRLNSQSNKNHANKTNCNTSRADDKLSDKTICGVDGDGINKFAALVIDEVINALAENNLDFYKSRLLGIGQEITLPDGSRAIMDGIDKNGHLIYRKNGHLSTLSYGDILI